MQIFSPLVGVSFRGKDARTIVQSMSPGPADFLSLEAEPDNPYDDHAVKVIYNGDFHIGYIAKENNMQIFEALMEEDAEFNIDIVSFENSIKPVLMISRVPF